MAEASAPEEFICPITKDIMADPVFTADGQTYERAAIEQWFARGRTSSPITGLALCSKTLTPNFALKNAIETYQKDRPELEERAHQVKDLQACLAMCERELQQANARAAASAEYVLHLQEKQPSSATLSNGSSSDSVAQPQSAHKYDDVVAAHKLSLQQRATMAERVSAQASSEQLELGKEIQACVGSIADSEAKAAREELQTTVQRKQVDALSELVLKKEAERDAIGAQVLAHTEPLGMDGPAMLASIRANPAATWDGPLRAAYAELHCECIALAMEKHSAHEASLPVEKAGVESRVHARGTKRKLQDLQSQLQEVDRRAEAANQKAIRARQAATDFSEDDMKAKTPWLQRLPWQPSVDNLRNLVALQKKCHAAVRSMRGIVASQLKHDGHNVPDLKGAGFTASDLREAGCMAAELWEVFSARELRECGCTAGELKDTKFTLSQLNEGGFTVGELKGAGFSVDQFEKAGFTLGDLKEEGFTVAELKQDGIALDRLKDGGFKLGQLREAGFAAGQLEKAGFTLGDLKEEGFTARDLKEDGATLDRLKEEGYSAGELKDAGFQADQLEKVGFTVGALKGEGFTATELYRCGIALARLKQGGFTVGELMRAGFAADQLEKAGFTLGALKDGGFTPMNLYAQGFTLSEVKDAFTAGQMKQDGIKLPALVDIGFTALDLKEAGFTAAELKKHVSLDQLREVGGTVGELKDGLSLDQLKTGGFTVCELKDGGFTAAELKNVGFTLEQLKEGGFSAGQLKGSGFTVGQLKACGFTAFHLKLCGFAVDDLKSCGYEASDLFRLCTRLKELKEGLPIVTLDGFGCLTARDKDNSSPWYAEPVWPSGQGRAKSSTTVKDVARALKWEKFEA